MPILSNQQFDSVIELARGSNIDLNVCPTCRVREEELAPGIKQWPNSTYRLEGKIYPCDCQWQDTLRWHYLAAGIPMSYWTLSETDFFGDNEALAKTQEYLDNWSNWKWHGIGVAYHSATQGTGKTMLATIIARHLIQKSERVYFIDFRDAVSILVRPHDEREYKEKRLRNSTVLILDEVGSGISPAQRDLFAAELESLIRFRTSGNNITILTTNLTNEELDAEYPRTFSLLSHKQRHIQVKGHDVRRAGEVDLWNQELIANGESKPIA